MSRVKHQHREEPFPVGVEVARLGHGFKRHSNEQLLARDERVTIGLDAFVECPSVFFETLTPEQFDIRQKHYRAAFEKARRELKRPAEFDHGDGI